MPKSESELFYTFIMTVPARVDSLGVTVVWMRRYAVVYTYLLVYNVCIWI